MLLREQGQLCVLAEDCNQPDYKKLVEALCAEHNVSLLSVPEAKQLGQWAGVRLIFPFCLVLCSKCMRPCTAFECTRKPAETGIAAMVGEAWALAGTRQCLEARGEG